MMRKIYILIVEIDRKQKGYNAYLTIVINNMKSACICKRMHMHDHIIFLNSHFIAKSYTKLEDYDNCKVLQCLVSVYINMPRLSK